jgi:hypothetical protein
LCDVWNISVLICINPSKTSGNKIIATFNTEKGSIFPSVYLSCTDLTINSHLPALQLLTGLTSRSTRSSLRCTKWISGWFTSVFTGFMSLIYLLPCHNSLIPNWPEQYKNCIVRVLYCSSASNCCQNKEQLFSLP